MVQGSPPGGSAQHNPTKKCIKQVNTVGLRMKLISRTFYLRIFCVCTTFLLSGLGFAETSPTTTPIKNCAPVDLTTAEKIDLKALHGKIVYVDFWASWCEPCRYSFPLLNLLRKEFSENDLVMIGISVDENKSDALDFLKKTPAVFQVALDTAGICPTEFNVEGMPSSFILGRNSELLYSHKGFRKADENIIRQKIAQAISAK